MARTTINLSDKDGNTLASFLPIYDGRRFISLNVGDDVTVLLAGFDADAVRNAREIAAALTNCAASLEAQLDETQRVAVAG